MKLQEFDDFNTAYSLLISLSKFNVPLIGTFDVTHAARALQSHDLSGEGIKLWITQGHGGPPRMNDQLNAGATSETAQNMKDNTHQAHTQSSQQGEYGMRTTTAK